MNTTATPRWALLFCTFVFATAGGLFLRLGISSLCWAVCYAGAAMWCYLRWRESYAIFARCWILFLPPIYYIFSTLWSIAPWVTLNSGLQILVTTIIAARLATTIKAHEAMDILALITVSAVVLSLANGAVGFFKPAWEHNNALLGIFTQKNAMGKATVLAALATVTVCAMRRRLFLAFVLALCFFPIVRMAKSVGAEMTYCALVAFIPLLMTTKTSTTIRVQIGMLMVVFAMLLVTAYLASGGDLLANVLRITDKSATLTGRTEIWQLGIERWRDDKLFGIGHKAFWSYDTYAVRFIHENIEEGLYWFHNIYIDILVAGGLVGAAICGAMLCVLMSRALRWFFSTGHVVAIGWGMVLCISMIAGTADNVMFTPHGFHHLLIVMGYVFGVKAADQQPHHRPIPLILAASCSKPTLQRS